MFDIFVAGYMVRITELQLVLNWKHTAVKPFLCLFFALTLHLIFFQLKIIERQPHCLKGIAFQCVFKESNLVFKYKDGAVPVNRKAKSSLWDWCKNGDPKCWKGPKTERKKTIKLGAWHGGLPHLRLFCNYSQACIPYPPLLIFFCTEWTAALLSCDFLSQQLAVFVIGQFL